MVQVYKHNLRKTEYFFPIGTRCTARAFEDWQDIQFDFTPKIYCGPFPDGPLHHPP